MNLLFFFYETNEIKREIKKYIGSKEKINFNEILENNEKINFESYKDFFVTVGPGSYSGIRALVSFAKGISFGLGKNLYGINYLDVLSIQNNGKPVAFIDGDFVFIKDNSVRIIKKSTYNYDLFSNLDWEITFERIYKTIPYLSKDFAKIPYYDKFLV